jgi:hypothetical protein
MDCTEVKNKVGNKLLKKSNVVAVGVGEKDGKEHIIVSVTKKYPLTRLNKKDIIPKEIKGCATDVVETGEFKFLPDKSKAAVRKRKRSVSRTDKHRPAFPGISIGHFEITAGTFGCLVKDVDTEDPFQYILSNNHVLANVNQAQIFDVIVQPGTHDGGTVEDDTVALLDSFKEINTGNNIPSECNIANTIANCVNWVSGVFRRKTRIRAVADTGPNLFDAALAIPTVDVTNEILEIGAPTGSAVPQLGERVRKSGRTTGLTEGTVDQKDVTVQVNMGQDGIAVFEGQVISNIGSDGGDSGSVIVNDDNAVVGLLFAGGNGLTVFSPIDPILDYFNVSIV